jgi:hypothetical protein
MPFHLRVLADPLSVDVSQAHQEKSDHHKRERANQGVLPSTVYSNRPDHKEVREKIISIHPSHIL